MVKHQFSAFSIKTKKESDNTNQIPHDPQEEEDHHQSHVQEHIQSSRNQDLNVPIEDLEEHHLLDEGGGVEGREEQEEAEQLVEEATQAPGLGIRSNVWESSCEIMSLDEICSNV